MVDSELIPFIDEQATSVAPIADNAMIDTFFMFFLLHLILPLLVRVSAVSVTFVDT
jgi:hypothetical protein